MDQLKTTLEKIKNLSVDYVAEFDPTAILQTDINGQVNLNRVNNGELYDNLVRNMHVTQISNGLKHKTAITKAAAPDAADYTIVIEDDVLYGDDITERVVSIVEKMSKYENNIVFLGLPSLTPIDETKGIYFRPTTDFYRILPCCDSYIASRATFAKILANYGQIRFTTNIQLSHICELGNIAAASNANIAALAAASNVVATNGASTTASVDIPNSLMVTPNIFLDGSKYGAYLSTIDPNGRLVFNPEYNKLALMIAGGKADDDTITSAFNNIKFKNHPDVMHLEAQYHITKGNYTRAGEILDSVLTICTQNGCVINTETEFLRTHMRMYKHMQV